jgi:hypothetical protein
VSWRAAGRHAVDAADGALLPMMAADQAVIAAVEHDLLNIAVIEMSFHKAMVALQPPRDREQAQLRRLRAAGAKIEAEIARLTTAIAEGGDLRALVEAAREREARRAQLAADLAALERDVATTRAPGALATALDTMREAVSDLKGTLHADIPRARATLRSLLRECFVFTPHVQNGEQWYSFAAPGTIEPLIAGALPKASMTGS